MKTKKQKHKKDRIDALVDTLDKYYFRIGVADNSAISRCGIWSTLSGDEGDIVSLFRTHREIEAEERFYASEHAGALESDVITMRSAPNDFYTLVGFVLGLRIAGISSEQTKAMARTWRVGQPSDD